MADAPDIVARLRSEADICGSDEGNAPLAARVMREAADEIDRLRGVVRLAWDVLNTDPFSAYEAERDKACEALEKLAAGLPDLPALDVERRG
jgi:hypothetical protein